LPTDASPQAVREIFLTAHELGLKGVTVYRYGSRPEQRLSIVDDSETPDCRECERRMADSRKIISDAAAAKRGANEHVRPPE
jgi:ribonucleotide reductase alpha subunit